MRGVAVLPRVLSRLISFHSKLIRQNVDSQDSADRLGREGWGDIEAGRQCSTRPWSGFQKRASCQNLEPRRSKNVHVFGIQTRVFGIYIC